LSNSNIELLQSNTELSDLPNNAKALVVQGTFHQGHTKFIHPGLQYSCMCLSACIKCINKDILQWSCADLDDILNSGDEMFSSHVQLTGNNARMLSINELPRTVESDNLYLLHVYDDEAWVGFMDDSGHMLHTLEDSLKACFGTFDTLFLILDKYTIVLFKKDNSYYAFDSHSRGADGLKSSSGCSVLLQFNCIMNLKSHIEKLAKSLGLHNAQFEITPVSVTVSSQCNDKTNSLLSGYFDDQKKQTVHFCE